MLLATKRKIYKVIFTNNASIIYMIICDLKTIINMFNFSLHFLESYIYVF